MTAVYLDMCCLNRFWDDQSQDRIKLETQALTLIFEHIEAQRLHWISSTALFIEARRNPHLEWRRRVELLLTAATRRLRLTARDRTRAIMLQSLGFTVFDAVHLAFAERGGADVLLTTDDKLERRARRYSRELAVPVENPVTWLKEWAGA